MPPTSRAHPLHNPAPITIDGVTARWPIVIFDIDGTLVDSVGLIVASYQHAFRTVLGHEEDEDRIKGWIGQSLYGSMQRAYPDQADRLFEVYTRWNEEHTAAMLSSFPGIPELMEDLVEAGVRIGAATSKRTQPAQWALQLGQINQLVPLLVAHEDVDEHKPSPKPLLLAMVRAGGSPDRTVYVGDAVVDIAAARNAGLDCVAVTWGAGKREDLVEAAPDVLCDTVEELRAALL